MSRIPPSGAAVTVVVPSYKHGHYLAECLASLVAQTRPDWEAVVVDDASPDGDLVQTVVADLADPRVRLVRHDSNRGLAASRNTGIREATTDLVLPLDADDKLAAESLELLSAALDEDPALDGAYGDVQLFGRSNDVLTFTGPPDGKTLRRIAHTVPGAGTMMRKALWERVGGYDESAVLRSGREDFEFWMRSFHSGVSIGRVERPLYLYRVSHTSMSLACRLRDHEVSRYMVEKNRAIFSDSGERKRFLARGYARAALARHEGGERWPALRLGLSALRLDPSAANLRLAVRASLSPGLARRLASGELRRWVPLAGYPLRGETRYRPFFIIGAARSGTTLLRRLLTSHSRLHIPPETFVLGEVMRGFPRWGRKLSWPEAVGLTLSKFEFHPEFHTFELWLGPLARELATVPPGERNLARIIDGFYRFHAGQTAQAADRWGDKTPLNTLEKGTLEKLLEVFPDAQFIHLVRDGCDVVYSHLSGGFMRDLSEAGERWVEMAGRARRFVAGHGDCSIEVRYEDLVSDPEAAIARLCDFLGVESESAMVSSEAGSGSMGDVPEWYWHEEVAKPVHSGNIGKGRRFFSSQERAELQGVIGAELEVLGYAPADRAVPDEVAVESADLDGRPGVGGAGQ